MGASYQQPTKTVLKDLTVVQNKGLSTKEAQRRLAEFGPNSLEAAKKINPLKLFFSQFNDIQLTSR